MARTVLLAALLLAGAMGVAGDACSVAQAALVRARGAAAASLAGRPISHARPTRAPQATAAAAGGACADAANNATSCAPACSAAVAGVVSACASAPVGTFSVFQLLEPARTLSPTANACRAAVLTQAVAYAPTAPGASARGRAAPLPRIACSCRRRSRGRARADTCSNGVLLLGGSVNNYGVCPRDTAASPCPPACAALLATLPSYCNATSVVTLPAAALAVYGVACTSATCGVGTAAMALPASAVQLQLPHVCALPTLPTPAAAGPAPSAAPARAAGAALAAAAAALAAAAL
jgi:hypothetical protein